MLIRHQPQPLLKPITLRAFWWLCERAHRAACAPADAQVRHMPSTLETQLHSFAPTSQVSASLAHDLHRLPTA